MNDHPDSTDQLLHSGRFVELHDKGGWEYVRRHTASGIVAVLGINDANEIILVEQFRVPVGHRVIELPAGIAGDIAGSEDEKLERAAYRELLEETGYEASGMEFLTEGPSSAGLSTEIISFFRATGLRRIGEGEGDGSENITVHHVPLGDLDEWLESKRKEGCLIDYKIQAALYYV